MITEASYYLHVAFLHKSDHASHHIILLIKTGVIAVRTHRVSCKQAGKRRRIFSQKHLRRRECMMKCHACDLRPRYSNVHFVKIFLRNGDPTNLKSALELERFGLLLYFFSEGCLKFLNGIRFQNISVGLEDIIGMKKSLSRARFPFYSSI